MDRESARALFSRAVEKEMKTDRVREVFRQDTLLPEAIRLSYIGALQTLKARDASFPLTKLKWLKRGMATLKKARQLDSLNVEVIFVQGVVCFRVPKLFGYRDDARRHFATLIRQLPSQWQQYDSEFVQEMLDFLRSEVTLTTEEEEIIAGIENQI
ncbi:hypothetical protein D6779_07920, partial [Candidatus Parcubacteria bacterium]